MSGRFMKTRRIVIPVLTAILIASSAMSVTGCGRMSQNDILSILQSTTDNIELEIDAQGYVDQQGKQSELAWTELGYLTSDQSLRDAFDQILGITGTTGDKNGVLYVNESGDQDQNNTLAVVMKNAAFTSLLEDEDTLSKLNSAVMNNYIDIDEDDLDSVYTGILRYFNLLPGTEDGYTNSESTTTRAEAMSLLMRAITAVDTDLTVDEDFESAVSENDYNIYAQMVDDDCYINTADKSLNETTYNQSMSKIEFVYMLVNNLYADELESVDTSLIKFSDLKDGGDMIAEANISETTEQLHSAVLKSCLNKPADGVDSDLYNAMCVAQKYSLIGETTNWDAVITQEEAAKMLCQALKNSNVIESFDIATGSVKEPKITVLSVDKAVVTAAATTKKAAYTVTKMKDTTMYAKKAVNVRKGPATSYKKLGTLKANQKVTVIGKVKYKGKTWYQIKTKDNTKKFVSASYLTKTKPATSKSSNNGNGSSNGSSGTNSSNSTAAKTQTTPAKTQTTPAKKTDTTPAKKENTKSVTTNTESGGLRKSKIEKTYESGTGGQKIVRTELSDLNYE